MDPLTVLRDFTTRGDLNSIRKVGEEFHFGDEYRFPCNIETAYRSKQGSLYTLESLVFFVKHTNVKHTDYMQQARSFKLQTVTFIDRKALLDYLEGKVQTTDAIELLAPTTGGSAPHGHIHMHLDQAEDDVEEYRPDDPSFGPSKRSRLDEHSMGADFGASTGIGSVDLYEPKEVDASQMISYIKERERPIRDRNTILLCHNKDFQEILTMITKRDEEKKKAEALEKQQSGNDKWSSRKEDSNDPSKFNSAYFKQQQQKKESGQKTDVGRSSQHSSHHRQSSSSAPRPGASLSAAGQKSGKSEAGPPIILVPSAFQTLLNMYNVKEFLEDGVYVPPDVKAKTMPKKPELVNFYRKMGRDVPVKYEVRDKPTVLSTSDWDRVVAVFVLGKEWQFKDWPFKDHVEIFSKIMGIYLRFEDDSVESAKIVKTWNVKIISLSKHKRHQDRTAVLQFWDSLEQSIRAKRISIVF